MDLKYSPLIFLAESAAPINGIDYVIIAVILLVIVAVIFSMIRHKKEGGGCYGCPHSKTCGANRDTCLSDNGIKQSDAE
ncbi:MAG TPA: FeoB-associated Cys-rich membrane protein [Clostridiaceae bacterium]|nr:FeoB-associated Cys-rich membrane protein [Clostridiaceae bacterium]